MKSKFYMTYARSRPNLIVPWAEQNNVPIMSNAAHRWSWARMRFNKMWKYDTDRIVDSGGYNIQSMWLKGHLHKRHNWPPSWPIYNVSMDPIRWDESPHTPVYPWSIQQYHDWLEENKNHFNWAAVMDYAGEERFDAIWPLEDRMEATIRNTLIHFNLDPDYDLRPVLQGRTIDDYIWSYDQLDDYGIPLEKVGLGTVCRISSEKKIADVEQTIRQECKKIQEIHGFGIKIEAFKHGATFDSADSQAWVRAASHGNMYVDSWGKLEEIRMPNDSEYRTVESFKNYYRYVDRVLRKSNSGGQLQLPTGLES